MSRRGREKNLGGGIRLTLARKVAQSWKDRGARARRGVSKNIQSDAPLKAIGKTVEKKRKNTGLQFSLEQTRNRKTSREKRERPERGGDFKVE